MDWLQWGAFRVAGKDVMDVRPSSSLLLSLDCPHMFCLSYGKVFSQFSLVLALIGNQIGKDQEAGTECQSKQGLCMVFSLCCLPAQEACAGRWGAAC